MHMEWFIDHVRIEQAIFEGAPVLQDGCLAPNDGPGHGLVLREDSLNAMGRALQFAAWGARS
jgi:L-alanine-DL-glutamate epimerase-like enolase superfamily enzyme